MKVIRLILDQSPPSLPDNNNWSSEFRSFVNACLKKNPKERPDIDTLFIQQANFLNKAQNISYL